MKKTFVSLASATSARAGHGSNPCQGVYYAPEGPANTALIATHYEIDFSEHYLAEFMAERGFGFLGWNTRFRGNGAYFALAGALVDIGAGVLWLREEAGVENIVLLGNSGGASLMSAYQAQGDEPGDLFISLCAHPGRPEVLTSWMDPSVTDETDLEATDPALDMFDEANGPPYSPEFIDSYRAAQVARNDRITAWAHAELERFARVGLWDRLFTVNRTWADLRFLDLDIDPSERTAGCYFGDPKRANKSAFGLASVCTLRSWLEMWSLAESGCRGAPNLARVTAPSLVVQSTADQGCYPSDAHAIFDALASEDKQLEFVGGDHYLLDPPDGRAQVADLIADWLSARTA